MSFSPRRQQELMNDPGLTILPPGPAWGSFAVSFVLLAVLVFAFIYRASTLINESRSRETSAVPVMSTEEKHRVNLALNARAGQQGEAEAGVMDRFIRWLPYRTDGETGALWPWVISRFAAGDHPFQENAVMEEDPSLLRRGLWIHVWIVGILLTLLSLVAASSLSPPAAVLMLLPAAFLVLLPRAVVFGPDLLYYLLFFLAWLCALRLLRKNSVWLHGIFGVVAGFAWLADTSGWIVVAAWFLAASCRWLREVLRRGHGLPDESWTCRNHFVGLVALVIGWVAVCSPRCGASMDRWGSPFFSWQQQWMWIDSTDRNALREWAKAHPGKNELDALPENERPSPANYLRTHSPEQIRDRMAKGWPEAWMDFMNPHRLSYRLPDVLKHRGLYPFAAAVIFLAAALPAVSRRKRVDRDGLKLPGGSGAMVLFTLIACAGYGAWYGWTYGFQSEGLAVLYLPLMLSLTAGAESLMILARMRGSRRWIWQGYQVVMWVVVAAAATGVILSLRA